MTQYRTTQLQKLVQELETENSDLLALHEQHAASMKQLTTQLEHLNTLFSEQFHGLQQQLKDVQQRLTRLETA